MQCVSSQLKKKKKKKIQTLYFAPPLQKQYFPNPAAAQELPDLIWRWLRALIIHAPGTWRQVWEFELATFQL